MWLDSALITLIFRNSTNSSSVSKLLDFRFANFHSRNLQSGTFAKALLYQSNARLSAESFNYFPLQRSGWFFSHTFSFLLSTPFAFDIEELLLCYGLIFQVCRNVAGSLESPVLFFLVRLLHKKASPYQAVEAERWSLYNLHKARLYSRKTYCRKHREASAKKKNPVYHFLLVAAKDRGKNINFKMVKNNHFSFLLMCHIFMTQELNQ